MAHASQQQLPQRHPGSPLPIGILGLQGCIEPHEAMFASLGLTTVRVRLPEDLEKIDRILLPGGESTSMLKLLDRAALFEPLAKFCRLHPTWGICAGAILLACEVRHPEQRSLGLMNIRATRNFYGSQRESFRSTLSVEGFEGTFEADFIRAPLLEPLGDEVQILAKLAEQPVMLQQGKFIASSFHVELGRDARLHSFFAHL